VEYIQVLGFVEESLSLHRLVLSVGFVQP